MRPGEQSDNRRLSPALPWIRCVLKVKYVLGVHLFLETGQVLNQLSEVSYMRILGTQGSGRESAFLPLLWIMVLVGDISWPHSCWLLCPCPLVLRSQVWPSPSLPCVDSEISYLHTLKELAILREGPRKFYGTSFPQQISWAGSWWVFSRGLWSTYFILSDGWRHSHLNRECHTDTVGKWCSLCSSRLLGAVRRREAHLWASVKSEAWKHWPRSKDSHLLFKMLMYILCTMARK